LGGPADGNALFDALEDKAGLIAGFTVDADDVVQIDEMGAI
jgi:hypothetical protein